MYRFCQVVFSLNASPFLLNATLRHHISKFAVDNSEFVMKLLELFYVDGFVGGGSSSKEVEALYGKTGKRMLEVGFKLRKWLTNDASVRSKIGTTSNVKASGNAISEEDTSYAKFQLGCKDQKVLGLSWDYDQNVIRLDLSTIAERAKGLQATKRNALRVLAGIFDPLGILGPVTITGRIIFQEACRQNSDWDALLDSKIRRDMEEWIRGFNECREITVRRCVYKHVSEEVIECSLHRFADASKRGYCAVIYLVYRIGTGRCAKMLTSKTRVAPLKALSIPRLDLMSALILVRLICTVEKAPSSHASVKRSRLWLDSKTALYWIMNRREWKWFVRHRVKEIPKSSKKSDWGYCPSEERPWLERTVGDGAEGGRVMVERANLAG